MIGKMFTDVVNYVLYVTLCNSSFLDSNNSVLCFKQGFVAPGKQGKKCVLFYVLDFAPTFDVWILFHKCPFVASSYK